MTTAHKLPAQLPRMSVATQRLNAHLLGEQSVVPTLRKRTISQTLLDETHAQGLRHAVAEQDARPKSLGADQAQKRSAGRTRVSIERHGSRTLDFDNGVGGCKPLIDALRRAGLITDDSPEHIDFVFTQKKVRREDVATVVTIEEIP